MLDSVPCLTRLTAQLRRFPGIGEKTAQRLAFFVLKQPRAQVAQLAQALLDVKDKVVFCSRCFHVTEQDPCPFCRAPERDDGLLCVVEQPQDVLTIERGGGYRGRYHVLHGVLSPLDGVGPAELNIPQLVQRVEQGEVREQIGRASCRERV